MDRARRVKLLRDGRGQTVRLPRGYELPGDEALLRREGAKLVLEPAAKRSLSEVLASLEPLDEPFPDIDGDLPPLRDVII